MSVPYQRQEAQGGSTAAPDDVAVVLKNGVIEAVCLSHIVFGHCRRRRHAFLLFAACCSHCASPRCIISLCEPRNVVCLYQALLCRGVRFLQ